MRVASLAPGAAAGKLRAIPTDVMCSYVLLCLATGDLLRLACTCKLLSHWVHLYFKLHATKFDLYDPTSSTSHRLLLMACTKVTCLTLRGLGSFPPVLPPCLEYLDLVDSFVDDQTLLQLSRRLPATLKSLAIGSRESVSSISDSGLSEALSHWPVRLRCIRIHGAPGVTDQSLFLAAARLPQLVDLDASRCGVGRGAFSRTVVPLEAINVSHSPYVDDHFIMRVASPTLRMLNLGGTALVTEQAFAILSACAPRLETLCLTGCPWVSDSGLAMLALPGLRRLNVARCLQATDAGLVPLIRTSALLEDLCADSCFRCSDFFLKSLAASCPLLVRLDVKGVNISDVGVEALARGCSRLEHVGLSSCTALGDTSLVSLAGLASLNSLDLSCVNKISDEGLLELRRVKLRALDVSWCFRLSSEALSCFRRLGSRFVCTGLEANVTTSPKLDASSGAMPRRSRVHSPRGSKLVMRLGSRPRLSSTDEVMPELSLVKRAQQPHQHLREPRIFGDCDKDWERVARFEVIEEEEEEAEELYTL